VKVKNLVNISYSDWDDVISGIPQGSALGPLLFLIYINDLLDICGTYSEVYAFADDAKFFRHILTTDDRNDLQCAVDALQNWSRKWLLNLNIKKCQVVSFGRHVDKGYCNNICDSNSHIIPLERGNKVLDLRSWCV